MNTKALLAFALLSTHALVGQASVNKRSIPQSLMDDFERFILFAEGADQLACPMPLGATLVTQVRGSTRSYVNLNMVRHQ